jgi:hypothetical protein
MSKLFACAFSLIFPLPACAWTFDWGGSASLYATASDTNWFGSRDNPLGYSQATLHGCAAWNNVALRAEGAYIDGAPRVNYALADFSLGDLNSTYGIRAGKIHRRSHLYDEVVFNSAARRFVFLPTTLYFPASEDWAFSVIGGQAYWRRMLFGGNGYLSIEVDYGAPWITPVNTRHEFSQLTAGQEIGRVDDWEHGGSLGISMELRYRDVRFLLAYNPDTNFAHTADDHPVVPAFEAEQETIVWGMEYRNNHWLASIEGYTGTIRSGWPGLDIDYDTYAVTVGRDITDKWQVSAFTSQIFLQQGPTKAKFDQRDSAVSIRYRLSSHLSLRLEGHYMQGASINLFGFGNDNDLSQVPRDWGIVVAGVDFVF